MDTWIVQMCRRRYLRKRACWGTVFAAGLVFAGANIRYIVNFVYGPYTLGPTELAQVQDPANVGQYFARISGSRTINTGVYEETVRTHHGAETGRSSVGFFGLEVGNRFLLVKSASTPPTIVEGALLPVPPDLDQALFGTPETQRFRSHFYPFYLDAASFREPGYWAIGGAAVFLSILAVSAGRTWRKLRNLSTQPVVARVASWGDPIGTSVEIEREYGAPQFRRSNFRVTDHYIIEASFFGFDVLRLSDLLWGYKSVTRHSVNFIPTGKTYAAVLVCYGGSAQIQCAQGMVDDVLRYAATKNSVGDLRLHA